MNDINRVIVSGKIIWSEVKNVSNDATILKLKVETNKGSISIGSFLASTKDIETAKKIVTAAKNGGLYMLSDAVQEDGKRDGDKLKFFDMRVHIKDIKVSKEPIPGTNIGFVTGTVLEAESSTAGTWLLLGCEYWSRGKEVNAPGQVRQRLVRVLTTHDDIEEDSNVLVTGSFFDKYQGQWHRHMVAETITVI